MMTPQARKIIKEVAEAYGIPPSFITSRRRKDRVVQARAEVAKRLRAMNYSSPRIGAMLGRDHTTILYYLGNGTRKLIVVPPRWHRPHIRYLAACPTYREPKPPKPPKPRKVYLVPYAGIDRDYEWKERPHDRRKEIPESSAAAGTAAGQIRSRTASAETGA
jgi:hypothetical protein